MPRRILTSHRVRAAMAIFVTYWVVAIFANPVFLAQFLAVVLVAVAITVLRKYWAQVWETLVNDDHGAISQLAQGIWLAFFGLVVGLMWMTAGRTIPGAEWMVHSPVVGFYLLLYVVAGSLHITARRGPDGRVQEEDLRDLLFAFGVGLVVAIALMILQLGGVLRLG